MKIERRLSAKTDTRGLSEILLRVSVCGGQARIKSGVFVPASRFRDGAIVVPRGASKEAIELREAAVALQELEALIGREAAKPGATYKNISEIQRGIKGNKFKPGTLIETVEAYVEAHPLSANRCRIYGQLIARINEWQPNLMASDLTEAHLEKFRKHLDNGTRCNTVV